VRSTRAPAYVAFDSLWLDGADLRSLPLSERRWRLQGRRSVGKYRAEGVNQNPEGGEKHGEDAAEAAKAGASMALANNTKVIGPQVDRGGESDCLLPTVPSRGNDRQTSAGPEPIGGRERSVLWHVNS
jgi:hypothetical protein